MRLSIDPNDYGNQKSKTTYGHRVYHVFLNRIKMHNVITADEEAGMVRHRNTEGAVLTAYGRVRIFEVSPPKEKLKSMKQILELHK